jgi:hypothetical protein
MERFLEVAVDIKNDLRLAVAAGADIGELAEEIRQLMLKIYNQCTQS